MPDNTDRKIYDDARRFAGAITASLSHEINNVLAIVNELSGLLDDFLVAAENGKSPSAERRQATAGKIAAQMERGKHHIQQLNRFAHSVDKPEAEFDAREMCEYTLELLERFARLRKVEIRSSLDQISRSLSGSPFDFQHIFFRSMEHMLKLVEQNAAIEVDLSESPTGIRICLFCDALKIVEMSGDSGERLSFLKLVLDRAQGALGVRHQPGENMELSFELPYTFNFSAEDASHF